MDKIAKALKKLAEKEKNRIKALFLKIKAGDYLDLDVKKLRGRDDLYRVRTGKMRIIFHKTKNSIKIVSLERRTDKTYK